MEDAELRNILFSIQGSIAGFQNDMSDVKNDIADMRTDIANMKTDITNMKADITNMKTDITNMKSDIVQLKGSVKTIELFLLFRSSPPAHRRGCCAQGCAHRFIVGCNRGFVKHPGNVLPFRHTRRIALAQRFVYNSSMLGFYRLYTGTPRQTVLTKGGAFFG